MRLVVVGAGIVGAAVAHEAARAGAEVFLLEESLPASGVSADSFAWIGAPRATDPPDPSTPLRRLALPAYRRLEALVPGVRVRWSGCVTWGDEQEQRPAGPGSGERLLDAAQLARLEPHLRTHPARAVHLLHDGAVDPVAVTRALVRAACRHGARLLTRTAAHALEVHEGRLVAVRTSAGTVPADAVVLAAGVRTPELCAPLGFELPVAPSPALLVRAEAPAHLVRTVVAGPSLEVRQDADGQVLIAVDHHGEVGPEDLRRAGEAALRRLSAAFDTAGAAGTTGAGAVRLLGVRVGARPVPADGLPVLGPLPRVGGVHLAVMHSAITLAPAAARLIAAEVVHGVRADELEPLRPARFGARGGG